MLLTVLIFVALDPMALLNSPLAVPVLGMVIAALLGLHLFLKLKAFLDARSEADKVAHPMRSKAEHAGAVFAGWLDGFASSNGSDLKALADPTKRAEAEAHLMEQAKAQAKATIDAALSGAKLFLLVLCAGFVLSLNSCAHADPLVDSGIGLDAAGPLAAATSRGMDRAVQQHMITPQAYAQWGTFLKGFIASYDLLVAEWLAAKKDQNVPAAQKAQDALTALVANLMSYADLLEPAPAAVDGGAL